ncbi:hypothetical protein Tsubulata_048224 [Turnera subulata]|uniref:Uncharacterized protein n=1 Tax=Turnera subulata TaxID=218843 RepID=A0A9Q0FIW8_9ROSI|nr:hypothetical protein Tsubulata_048224 [Turnera subulata]
MGEVAVSSGEQEVMAVTVAAEEEEERKKEGSSEVVRWEKFLPRMVLRVLLVEADDSTRQIISALLRKCSYRVAAVPDGLMAWETLKGRPHNIDLILTEVELPSISGYALLTLVMEHDICKNIPVIMMSSHDSISMVLKCMLKGAADFLIKPVRRNELRNLWQHVWRRQTVSFTTCSSFAVVEVEATSENNAASNRSSDCATSSRKTKGCSEKGSDAHGFSQQDDKSASDLSNTNQEKCEEYANLDKKSSTPESKAGESSDSLEPVGGPCTKSSNPTALTWGDEHASAKTTIHNEEVRAESHMDDANVPHSYDEALVESSGAAIDLIGTFDNGPKYISGNCSLNDDPSTFEFNPQLELSLRRFNPNSSKSQGVDERHALNHSKASAFSWYNGKALQALFPSSTSNSTVFKEDTSKSPEVPSTEQSRNIDTGSQGHDASLANNHESTTALVIGQTGKPELAYPSPQIGLVQVPGVNLDNISSGYGHGFPSVYYAQPSMPSAWSPKLANQREQSPFQSSTSQYSNSEVNNSEQNHRRSDETTNHSAEQSAQRQNNVEAVEELKSGSPAAGQSTSSSLCNSVANPNHSSAYGSLCSRSDGNDNSAVTAEKSLAPESSSDGGFLIHDRFRGMDSLRSSQREAALTKFRLKRKDRCYEKKVRYQSRKKLAEQRPRVKGQFVRQVQNEAPMADANA